MRYRVSEVKISAAEYADRDHRMEHIRQALERALRKRCRRQTHSHGSIPVSGIEIIRESIDARKKPDVKAVYTLDFDAAEGLPLPAGGVTEYRIPDPAPAEAAPAEMTRRNPSDGDTNWETVMTGSAAGETGIPRPVIAGFGPCGIFAALILAEAGLAPIVLERGKPVDQRAADVNRFWEEGILDPESNVQFGEGGAGTFSDGKLTTGIRDVRIRKVLQEFVNAGADPEILYQQRPHIGTDRLKQIIPNLRKRIQDLGGEIRFGTKLTGLETDGSRLTAVQVSTAGVMTDPEQGRIPADHLILAIGHSARDTFRMLRDLPAAPKMEQKPFSIGVRIEHPQERIDAAQYGDAALAEVFGPAAYKLHYRCGNGRGVYTFCMCPGGRVINASSEEGHAVTNGMSDSGRDSGTANSGLLVDVRPSDFDTDDPLAGIEFQRRYERLAWEAGRRQGQENGRQEAEAESAAVHPAAEQPGCLPRTSYGEFRTDPEDPVRGCLPAFASEAILEAMPHLGQKLQGFDADDAVMTAVETRSSSPVRILRDASMESAIKGLIPAGEGPGYAGGIMSAAVDGIKAAEQIIRRRGRHSEDTEL